MRIMFRKNWMECSKCSTSVNMPLHIFIKFHKYYSHRWKYIFIVQYFISTLYITIYSRIQYEMINLVDRILFHSLKFLILFGIWFYLLFYACRSGTLHVRVVLLANKQLSIFLLSFFLPRKQSEAIQILFRITYNSKHPPGNQQIEKKWRKHRVR